MFGQHFYHKQIRNAVIYLARYLTMLISRDWILAKQSFTDFKSILSYAPKEKFIARLDQQADLQGTDSKVALTLFRMSFDITSYAYDATRKLNKNQKYLLQKMTSGDTKR